VAAVLAGLGITLTLVLFISRFNDKVTYATGYGEVREVMLPDSSMITLNANSVLTYEDFWAENNTREVWIQGEAFFKISQMDTLYVPPDLKQYKSFIVHTDEMDVKVLGTQFNVQTRREKTSVTLNSGKVALRLHKSKEKEPLILLPGDNVTYDQSLQILTRSQVEPEKYSAWRFGKIIFDKVSLYEVALKIEDQYGVKVIFTDPQIAQQEFVGSVPSDNVDALITSISRLYHLEVVKKGNTIIFQ
jgi:ferric-dicitrate binding protein FerR (iron transport regulator)